MGATLLTNDLDVDTAAIDNCKFALIEDQKIDPSWEPLRTHKQTGLYWGRRKFLCWAASKYEKFHWN